MLDEKRSASVRRVLWATMWLNFAVAGAKIVCGTLTSTLSMVADGYHSLLDGTGNILGLLAISVAHRPPDEDHQYGHRKFEVLASTGISLLLFGAAAEILYAAYGRVTEGSDAIFSSYSVAVMLFTMAVNLGVSRYEARRGRELHSPFLVADSRHTASDLYASASVLIALVALKLGVTWLDPVAAVVIGAVIIRAGYKILRWSLGVLSDERLIEPALIEQVAAQFPHVRFCHAVRTRGFADAVFLDMKLGFDAALSLREVHEICDLIEGRLKERFPEIADIVVHPEPVENGVVGAMLTRSSGEE
jgi:cation diffusion facilitator family transporter